MISHKFGLNAQRGEPTTADLEAFRELGFGAVRFQCGGGHGPDTVNAYRLQGARVFHARICLDDLGLVARTPESFVSQRLADIRQLVEAGVRALEVHFHPNAARGGFGFSWNSPTDFSNWYIEVLNRLRQAFAGQPVRFGFPALSPGNAALDPDPQAGGRPRRPVGDVDFLDSCRQAVMASDFIGVQTIWRDANSMRAIDSERTGEGGLRFVRHYHERFPDRPIVISRFSNSREDLGRQPPDAPAWRAVGDEYAEFLTLCAQYDWIEAAYAHTLRDQATFPHESWMTDDGQRRRIFEGVQTRPALPEPDQLKLRWPTVHRQINQLYGLRQLDYARYSGGYLRGGHEGIDLAAPEGSEITACLRGVVRRSESTRGSLAGGYGNYGEVVDVDSDVPAVGRVTLTYAHLSARHVQPGDVVEAGQRIGLAGQTGNAQGVHLHLSLRIYGVPVYAQLDYLNPGLYLDESTAPPAPPPPQPGAPRIQYPRTYVLVPPPAGLAWVEAILRATWDGRRYTVGGSADDAGLGDLGRRRVIAVNPGSWPGDLFAWYQLNYPGVDYVPLSAPNPATLEPQLRGMDLVQPPPTSAGPDRGRPLNQYRRTYLLLPPTRGSDWAIAAARATWTRHRLTIGGSADDAGIGALDYRRVIAVNPTEWGGGDLRAWYAQNYPGVEYVPVPVSTTAELGSRLQAIFP